METTQITCPSCQGAQSGTGAGQYTCEWCLAPFTAVDAHRQEQRQKAQDEGWLNQRLGAVAGSSGVDAASRAFIFRQRLFPDLRRDVDRALEGFTNARQHALVLPPVPVPPPRTQTRNPLVADRAAVLALADLRSRLANEAILGFAVNAEDQGALQSMERRMADVVHLSNVAEAGFRRDAVGYAVARRNLEALVEELDESLVLEAGDPGLAQFLGGLRARYVAMAEFARVCEEACSASAAAGTALAERVDEIADALADTGAALQNSAHDPAQTMPCAVGVQVEVAAMRVFARWLRAYDVVTARSLTDFPDFLEGIEALSTGAVSAPEGKVDLVDVIADALLTMRGERAASVIEDFSWVEAWAEGQREKKTWGLFGNEESTVGVRRFLAPVWVADVSYSASTGTVFKEGVESRTVALVDACSPEPARVVFLVAGHASLSTRLAAHASMPGVEAAVPNSTARAASAAITAALTAQTTMLNARPVVRGLAWVPTAVAQYSSPKGRRAALSCLNGLVSLDGGVVKQVDLRNQLVERFG